MCDVMAERTGQLNFEDINYYLPLVVEKLLTDLVCALSDDGSGLNNSLSRQLSG